MGLIPSWGPKITYAMQCSKKKKKNLKKFNQHNSHHLCLFLKLPNFLSIMFLLYVSGSQL